MIRKAQGTDNVKVREKFERNNIVTYQINSHPTYKPPS